MKTSELENPIGKLRSDLQQFLVMWDSYVPYQKYLDTLSRAEKQEMAELADNCKEFLSRYNDPSD